MGKHREPGENASNLSFTEDLGRSVPQPAHSEFGLPIIPNDAYRIEGEHARGGMGRVLRAEDRRLRRPVAVKELIDNHAVARQRFLREAELTARLQHPSIVPVYEAGFWPDGRPFYAMKFITGRSLRELIADGGTLEARLTLLPHVVAVADAINYAHSHGIVHRDLKPTNVVVGEFGETMVVDWGLGKDLAKGADATDTSVAAPSAPPLETVSGEVVGTPAFMAPEQAAGEPVDERADIYAVGAILYNVLCGEPPYVGANGAEVLSRVGSSDPLPVETREPSVPRDLVAIVTRAMARDRTRRYRTMRELATDLKRFQTGQLVSARSYSRRVLLVRFLRRHARILVPAALFALLAAIVGAVSVRRIVSERRVAELERARAQARTQELTLVHARSALERDPTESIAWLKTATLDEASWSEVAAIAADARARGVARAVLRVEGGGALASPTLSADGRRVYLEADPSGILVADLARPAGFQRLETPQAKQNDLFRTADGKHLVVAAMTGQLIDIDESHRPRLLGVKGLPQPVTPSPVGSVVATCGQDGAVRVWDLASGVSRPLLPSVGDCGFAAWSPDGNFLAATGRDLRTRVWDVRTSAESDPPVARGRHHAFAWSPSGRYAVTSNEASGMTAVELATGAVHTAPSLPEDLGGDFLPGDRYYNRAADGTLRIWSLGGGTPRLLRAHDKKIEEAALAGDGSRLITCSEDETARVWDTESFVSRTLRGHVQSVLGCALSRDGTLAVTAGNDGTARIWDLGDDGTRAFLGNEDDAYGLAFSPDGTHIATGDVTAAIRVWDVKTGQAREYRGHKAGVERVAFFADGRQLASGSEDGTARIWDLASGGSKEIPLGSRVLDLLVVRDGSAVVTSSADGVVRIIDVGAAKLRAEVRAHDTGADHLALSPDNRWVASCGYDGFVTVIALETGAVRQRLAAHQREATGVAFARSGRSLLSVGVDGALREWDVETGRLVQTLRGHTSRIKKLVVAPDQRHVVTGGDDHTVRIWDLESGKSLVLLGHTDGVIGLDVSRDGRYVVSVGRDATARLWDAQRGTLLDLARADALIFRVLISPDSTQFAHIGWDRKVHLVSIVPSRFVPESAAGLRAWLDQLTTAVVGADARIHSN
jgi:WD40 repeat protein